MTRLVWTHDRGGTIGGLDAAGVFGCSGGPVSQRAVGRAAGVWSWRRGSVLGRPTAAAPDSTAAPASAATASTAAAVNAATATSTATATPLAPGAARDLLAAGGAWLVTARAADEGHCQRQQQRGCQRNLPLRAGPPARRTPRVRPRVIRMSFRQWPQASESGQSAQRRGPRCGGCRVGGTLPPVTLRHGAFVRLRSKAGQRSLVAWCPSSALPVGSGQAMSPDHLPQALA